MFYLIDGLRVEEDKTNMFGVNGASMELFIPSPMCANPLAWWKTHEGQFQNVNFLARQVFGILRSQIETKRMLNLASVLIALKRYHLQVQNLD